MADTATVFGNIISNNDINRAAAQLTENVNKAFESACEASYVSNRIRRPPWETKEVREAKAGVRHPLRQARSTKSDKDWSELRSHQAEYHRLRGKTVNVKFKEYSVKEWRTNPLLKESLI